MTTTQNNATAADAGSPEEFVVTGVVDAPRDLVWQARTDADRLAQWWHFKGCTMKVAKHDLRPGGVLHYVMTTSAGHEMWGLFAYRQIEPQHRLVYVNAFADAAGNIARHPSGGAWPLEVLNTLTFEDAPSGQTRVTLRATPINATEAERAAFQAASDNMRQGFAGLLEQLKAHLAADRGAADVGGRDAADNSNAFVVTRVFDAPRDLVWKAHTEADRLARWWGPKGFGMKVAKLDLRPGGLFHYAMTTPAGQEMWGKFVYREISPQTRLVYVASFSDASAGVARHPMSESWPLETLNTLTFEEHDGKTTLTLRGGPINATDAERATFAGAHDGMRQGFKGTLDQLDAYLAATQAG